MPIFPKANFQASSAANQQGSLLESIPPLQSFNQQFQSNNFYAQNNFANQPFSCANSAASNGMMVSSHAFQNVPQVGAAQHFDSAEMSHSICGNLIGESDDMTGIVRSDQLRTHTMTVTKSNHGGVMSNLPDQSFGHPGSNGHSSSSTLQPLNSNQLAELKVVKNGDENKSQEKEGKKKFKLQKYLTPAGKMANKLVASF